MCERLAAAPQAPAVSTEWLILQRFSDIQRADGRHMLGTTPAPT